MFRAYNTTKEEFIGLISNIHYVKYEEKAKHFHRVPSEEIADGIVINNIVYNFKGDIIPGADHINLEPIEDNQFVFFTDKNTMKTIDDVNTLQQIILYQDNVINMMEEAIMELDNNQAVDEGGES